MVRIALFFVCSAFLLAAAAPLGRKFGGSAGDLLTGVIAAIGTFLLTLGFVRWERVPLRGVGAVFVRGSLPRFAIGFCTGLFLVALYTVLSAAAVHVRWERVQQTSFAVTINFFAFIALACREELGFRGYPLFRLTDFFGLWAGQIVVALVFGAEHILGGLPLSQALLGASVGSLLFGMAAIATRGLAVPIGLHAAWNFADWTLGGKTSPGLWRIVVDQRDESSFHLARTLAYIAVMALGTIFFWMWDRQERRRSGVGPRP